MNTKIILTFMHNIKCYGYRLSVLLMAASLLSACAVNPSIVRGEETVPKRAASYEIKGEDSEWTSQYAALYESLGKQAQVNKLINLCERDDLLYVKIHNHSSINSDAYTNVVMTTLENNTFFEEIATRQPTIYINVKPEINDRLDDGRIWYDLDDPLTIRQIRALYPNQDFLILEVRMQEFRENDPLTVTLSLIDPTDGSTLVLWRNSRAAWYWIGDTQTQSMIRDFNQWLGNVAKQCECRCYK